MRDQIAKLKTIRKLRLEQRQREHQAARQELIAFDRQLERMRQEFIDNRSAMEQCKAPPGAGETVTLGDLERRASMARQYEKYLQDLKKRIMQAMSQRDVKKKAVSEALKRVREAEKGSEQLETVDERLAEEEARLAEIQEELQMEIIAKPRWSAS
jgi:hypothetical protein